MASDEDASASHNGNGIVETDLLIIGAGPAGASLACFLAGYGERISYRVRFVLNRDRIERNHPRLDTEHRRYPEGTHHEHGSSGMSTRHWT
jgi:thioredoxin reductase